MVALVPPKPKELESAARVLVALGDEHLAMGGLRALLRQPSEAGNGNRLSLKAAAKAASHQAERELILKVLTRTRWNRRRAAAEGGGPSSTVRPASWTSAAASRRSARSRG